MKKNILYKSIGLYTKEELEEIRKEYECRDIVNGEYNDIDYEDLQDYNDVEWNYSFGEEATWKTGWVNQIPVVITGKLGLWNGNPTIKNVDCESIEEAVLKCINDMDDVEIYEDQYGNLKIDAYHHDGTNHFIIKMKTNKGNRCLHFTKLWDKFNKEFNEGDDRPF